MSTPKAETGDGAARDKMKQFLRPLWMMVPQIVKASLISRYVQTGGSILRMEAAI